MIVGLLVVPRFIRAVVALKRPETTLVATVGVCFVTSLAASSFGYSVALGAFLAGMLVAESGAAAEVEHLVAPVRDMFAAIFFVAVGMQIEPRLMVANWLPIVVLTGMVVVGKFCRSSSPFRAASRRFTPPRSCWCGMVETSSLSRVRWGPLASGMRSVVEELVWHVS